jgi:hypothetical protein
MKKIYFLAVMLMTGVLTHAQSFYISPGYIDHIKNGGMPAAYAWYDESNVVVVEIDTSGKKLIRHRAVQLQPEYYTLLNGKYYIQNDEDLKYIGKVNKTKWGINLVERYAPRTKSYEGVVGSYVPIDSILPAAKGIRDVQKIFALLNENAMPGIFNLSFDEGDSTRTVNNLAFRPNGIVTIGTDTIGSRGHSTFMDCNRKLDRLHLQINDRSYEFVLRLKPESGNVYFVYTFTGQPCDNSVNIGVLTKTIAKL